MDFKSFLEKSGGPKIEAGGCEDEPLFEAQRLPGHEAPGPSLMDGLISGAAAQLVPPAPQQPILPDPYKANLDPLSDIEQILALSPDQALLVKNTLLAELTSGDSSGSRLKAAQVLIALSAQTKAERQRYNRPAQQSAATTFLISNTINAAQKVSDTYEQLSNNRAD